VQVANAFLKVRSAQHFLHLPIQFSAFNLYLCKLKVIASKTRTAFSPQPLASILKQQ
jgi:hypothetical protein